MYLKYIQIVNFKNLKTARFEFAKGANTIIGENDSGKSNALTAIRILLDDNYYYNTKRLKETDFSYALGDWRGHWIIISAFFDEISSEDKSNEFCAELTPEQENIDFLKSYIRCADKEFGTVSLFIRPCRAKRAELAEAAQNGTFETVRSQIKLSDYEFYYTSRSQADFTDENVYKSIVGDICAGQRKCSIVTDLDVVVDGAKKSSQVAMDRGASRREKLSRLFDANPYVSAFYAPHTLEVDFASEDNNKRFICAIIKRAYKDAATKEKHVLAVKSGTEAERYDSVMTVAKNIKKGWYATLLAEKIDAGATIPMYILDSIAFVAKDILSEKLLWKMANYSFNAYDLDEDYDDLKTAFKEARSSKEIRETIGMFCDEFPNDMVSLFIAKAGGLSV